MHALHQSVSLTADQEGLQPQRPVIQAVSILEQGAATMNQGPHQTNMILVVNIVTQVIELIVVE